MIDQYAKYKKNKDVKIVVATFHNDNRGYSYLTDLNVAVGDIGIARMRDGEMKCLTIQSVKDSSHIMPNPPFKKYAWLCGIIAPLDIERYQRIDDDVGKKEEPKVEVKPEKDDLDDRMNAIFG